MPVLSIQSAVVYGHVGNSAAVFALQRLGIETWALPSVLLSNHTGYGHWQGGPIEATKARALVAGIDRIGAFPRCQAVLSGYLGHPDLAAVVAEAVAKMRLARAAGADALYCLDPVFGNDRRGRFVDQAVEIAIAGNLVALADIITPNRFELAALSAVPVGSIDQALAAADALAARGPARVLCKSLPAAGAAVAVMVRDHDAAWLIETPRLATPGDGAGDVLGALLLAHVLGGAPFVEAAERAVAGVYALLKATAAAGRDELCLIEAQALLADPPRRFALKRLREA